MSWEELDRLSDISDKLNTIIDLLQEILKQKPKENTDD